MSEPFDSSRQKFARAEEHFIDLQKKINEFIWSYPYERVIEPHPDDPKKLVHKFRLNKPLPPAIANIAADLAGNLRNALDNAAYDIAIASGLTNPKFTSFPFAGSVEQMANSLGRSKDLPKEIQSLFCGFQPYLGGDDLLWALNEICVADKHKMVIPIGAGAFRTAASVHVTGWFSMPDPHVWNRAKNEMEVVTILEGSTFEYDFDFRTFVAFNEIGVIDGKPVFSVLHEIGSKVHRILIGMEAEARRLKIIK